MVATCEAATRAHAQSKLLLRRARTKQEPFIVSFRVAFNDGPDNVALAKNLSAAINTPHTKLAGEMGYSVARIYNGTFPPVMWPPSTSPNPPAAMQTPAPRAAAMGAPVVQTTPAPTAMETALESLKLARENRVTYDKLMARMTGATRAHADALVFGNAEGTTPLPTLAPLAQKRVMKAAIPHTLGRLIYDAFVGTKQPLDLTTPMPTPAVPTVAVMGTLPPAAQGR